MALNKQYCVYGVDTGCFYFEEELFIEKDLFKYRAEKKAYKEVLKNTDDIYLRWLIEVKIKQCNKRIAGTKSCLSDMMNVNKNRVRSIIPYKLTDRRRITLFDGVLTRVFGLTPLNYDIKLTKESTVVNEEIMVVSVFYFEVMESLIKHGYNYNGYHYVYFASSAGQIRTKRGVFVREDLLNKHWNTLSCGLTIDEVNRQGGMNLNKFNAYLALCNSATDLWRGFDIDRCIVVDDFETNVIAEVDYVNDIDYSITRQTMPVPIPHTDGCGMVSPELSDKNFMVRLPWVKGLLGVFDFQRFIKEKNCSPVVKDIWGDEWNILEDNIQVIFTKSQLKMAAYYPNWQTYKDNFKKYNCQAGKCNIEDDRFKKANINYQMVSSFIKYTDKELQTMCKNSVKLIEDLCFDQEKQLELFGVSWDKDFSKYNGMQKCLSVYNNLIYDSYFREQIRELRKKLIRELYSAKFKVNGYYTFIMPDLFAFCEWLFQGVSVPKGLLQRKEVHCKLHKFGREVDCLRSPHLYQEHSIQNNVDSDEISKWFTTKACYISTHDLITKEIMNDVDGDSTLIIQDTNIINVAKRNQKDIVPLFYNMHKAGKEIINADSRYKGLAVAFTGGNIGMISNNIAKIKNSPEILNPEMKDEAFNCLKWETMLNNETIDYAKCLYKSTPPKAVSDIIKKYVNRKLPHFFIYAKNKTEEQVEPPTDSFVDKIFITYPESKFKVKLSGKKKFDYRMLMSYPDIVPDKEVLLTYQRTVDNIKLKNNNADNSVIISDIMSVMYQFNYAQFEICDMLIKDMFADKTVFKNDRRKDFLFKVYGDIIYENIVDNKGRIDNDMRCIDCGEAFHKVSSLQIRCKNCQSRHIKLYDRKRKLTNKRSSVG